MENTNNILVALGFSDYAKDIFNYAAGLALKLEARLIVASVLNSRDVEAVATISAMGYEVDEAHYIESVEKERRKRLNDFIGAGSFPSDRIKTVFKLGHPADELLKIIVSEKIDLVVMGTKGRTDLEHILTGSVAEKLFRHSPAPIVFYRDPKQVEHLKKRIHPD